MQYQHAGSLIVAGRNYGQGSSREHAALAPRYLGVRAVLAQSFARIHWQNLVNFDILPFTFLAPNDWHDIDQGDVLRLLDVRQALRHGKHIAVQNQTRHATYMAAHTLTDHQVAIILAESLIDLLRAQHTGSSRTGT
jgi:aconitate hydratase